MNHASLHTAKIGEERVAKIEGDVGDLLLVKVCWSDLKEGDEVFIGYLDYQAHGQPPSYLVKGPHSVQSVQNRELKNGVGIGQFHWDIITGRDLWKRV